MRRLFVMLLVALVPLMALDANGTELRKDKKAKTEKVSKKKKKGKVKEVIVGYGVDNPDGGFIDDGLMNGLPGKYSVEDLHDGGDLCFRNVDVMPSYPGGEVALLQDVANNIVYPPNAQNISLHGQVVLQFVVEKDGSVGEVRVVKSLWPFCDTASIEAVKKLKRFTPGLVDEKPVRTWYTLPITFKIDQSDDNYKLVKTWDPDTAVFRDPYSMPFYPGGDHALIQDLAENLVYPPEAVKEGTQGRVILQFVIKKDGSIDIDNITVTRSLSPECDQAAIEAVKKLKKFKPGLKDAKPVNVRYTLPVSFKLPAEE